MKHLAILAAILITAGAFAETNALQGVWTTGPVLSQLGMVITEKEFKADGSVSTRVQFLQMTNVPPMVVTGRYSIADGNLTTIVRGGTNTTPCTVEGDTLVVTDERKREVRMTRKKD